MKTKKQVIDCLHSKFNHLTRADISNILLEYSEIQVKELVETKCISLPSFGKLEIVERKERKARNLATGEVIVVPASKRIKYKPKEKLKERIKNL